MTQGNSRIPESLCKCPVLMLQQNPETLHHLMTRYSEHSQVKLFGLARQKGIYCVTQGYLQCEYVMGTREGWRGGI